MEPTSAPKSLMARLLCCCCSADDDDGFATSARAPLLPDSGAERRRHRGRGGQAPRHAQQPPRAPLPPVAHGADAWRSHVGSEVIDSEEPFRTPPPLGLRPPTAFVAPSSGGEAQDGGVDANCCPTCLEDYTEENPSFSTPCGHSFHLVCMLAWYEQGKEECPLCGAKVNLSTVVDGGSTSAAAATAAAADGDDGSASSGCDDESGSESGYCTPQEWRGSTASGYSSAAGGGRAIQAEASTGSLWHDARSVASAPATDDDDAASMASGSRRARITPWSGGASGGTARRQPRRGSSGNT